MKEKLTEKKINAIVKLLKEGKQETELIYAGKTRDMDVLIETMAVPLQRGKVFGDNLQVLKTLLKMKEEGKLKNADGAKGVRLIYIDPPSATKQEFMAKNREKAYQDKIISVQFGIFKKKIDSASENLYDV